MRQTEPSNLRFPTLPYWEMSRRSISQQLPDNCRLDGSFVEEGDSQMNPTILAIRRYDFKCDCKVGDAGLYDQWEDGRALRKVRGIQTEDLSDVLWRDPSEEQVQNVFKRFLFHYSKARNSVGAVQQESHSVHPLMRLSPKLSQRRKKVLLLKI
ncbi:uncharacterized protein nms isoform X1 [Xiphias gladius]|uniref:uncharacterized protein nms isoform X1 n=1 Tax=Xiphias gladius TaxID=8245 RepID=UPI001A9918BB|nr:uncharacterized protein nms isoform X1 [Xiphias gladius]